MVSNEERKSGRKRICQARNRRCRHCQYFHNILPSQSQHRPIPCVPFGTDTQFLNVLSLSLRIFSDFLGSPVQLPWPEPTAAFARPQATICAAATLVVICRLFRLFERCNRWRRLLLLQLRHVATLDASQSCCTRGG